MAEKQLAENNTIKKQKDLKLFQAITLTALSLIWIGYGYALYEGNNTNISGYSLLILAFSLANSNVLFTREKAQKKALNILAKLHGVLFFVWAIITIVSLILR